MTCSRTKRHKVRELAGKLLNCCVAIALAGLMVPSLAYADVGDSDADEVTEQEEVVEQEEAVEEAEEGVLESAADAVAEAADAATDAVSDAADAVSEALSAASTDDDEAMTATAYSSITGSGTESDPYVIGSTAAFEEFYTTMNSSDADSTLRSAYYELTCNIDTTEITDTTIGAMCTSSSLAFAGVFDGGGYTVTLAINNTTTSSYTGLFGYVNGGTVKDVTIAGSVSGYYYTGGAVGYAATGSTISGVVNTANVTQAYSYQYAVGGVVGYALASTVEECGNTGTVTANYTSFPSTASKATTAGCCLAGGVVGYASNSSSAASLISACYNTGSVTGYAFFIGGIVGALYNNKATSTSYENAVENCYNTGSLSHTGTNTKTSAYIAGIVGKMSTSTNSATYYAPLRVESCYNVGTLTNESDGTVTGYCCGIIGSLNDSYVSYPTFSANYYLDSSASYAVYNYMATSSGKFETKTETALKTSGFWKSLSVVFCDDNSTTQLNGGYPILRWQDSTAESAVQITAGLENENNASTSNALTLTVTSSSGSDVSSSFSASDDSDTTAGVWTAVGLSDGTYTYTVAKKGYTSATGTFTLSSSVRTAADEVTLAAETYTATLTVSPASAAVTLSAASATASSAGYTTTTDETADTATYVYSGLYNVTVVSYTVALYGYTTQTGTMQASYANTSASVTLVAESTYTATVNVTASGSDDADVPTVVLYYTGSDTNFTNDEVYDSRDDESAPTASSSGTSTFAASGLVSGEYTYLAYLGGYTSATGTITVSGSNTTADVTLSVASTTWDGTSTDVGWYMLNKDATEMHIYSAPELASLVSIVAGTATTVLGTTLTANAFNGVTLCLEADLDLGGTADEPVVWTPIGTYVTSAVSTSTTVFHGSFDGGGHTISNMYVTSSSTGYGLFSAIVPTSATSDRLSVCDLTLENPVVNATTYTTSTYTRGCGALSGRIGYCDVSNVDIDGGSVTGVYSYVGGICGYAGYTTLSYCSNSADVSQTYNTSTATTSYYAGMVGGIVGDCVYASTTGLSHCTNSGTISGGAGSIGGIVGLMRTNIADCVNTGTVTTTNTLSVRVTTWRANQGSSVYECNALGGIAGGITSTSYGTDTISRCANLGTVSGAINSVGGIIGSTNQSSFVSLYDCYNTGAVTNTADGETIALSATSNTNSAPSAGGLVGMLPISSSYPCEISGCYNAGVVSCAYTGEDYATNVGSLVGFLSGSAGITISGNYFDADVNASTAATNAFGYHKLDSSFIDSSTDSTDDDTDSTDDSTDSTEDDTEDIVGITRSDTETMTAAAFVKKLDTDVFTTDYELAGDVEGSNINKGYPIFTYQAKSLVYADIESIINQLYTGEACEPGASLSLYGTELVQGTDFTVSYTDNVNVGTATATITGTGDYSGTVTTTFAIVANDLTQVTVTGVSTKSYGNTAQTLTVTYGETTLVEGTDYSVSYANVDAVGTATVTLTGIGNWAGVVDNEFTVEASDLSTATAVINNGEDMYYSMGDITPGGGADDDPTLEVSFDGGTTIIPSSDYEVSYEDNVNAGTAKVIVTAASDNVTGTGTFTFTILPVPLSEDFGVIASGVEDSYDYEAAEINPELVIVDSGSYTLVEDTDYTIEYDPDNINSGEVTMTVTGIGNYTGTLTYEFVINPKAFLDDDGVVLLLTTSSYVYDGTEKEPGVMVFYNGTYLPETETTTTTETTTETDEEGNETEVTTEVETEVTNYTVSYSDNVNAGTGTLTIKGTGAYAHSKSITFTIVPASISDATVTLDETSYTYDGTSKTPGVTVALDDDTELEEGTDYTVAYSSNTAAGTASVVVTGTGNYTGSTTASFTIEPASVDVPEAAELTYTGAEQTAVAATKYYTVSGGSATAAGSYTATLSLTDTNNYEWADGTTAAKQVSYSIAAASIGSADAADDALSVTLSQDSYTYDGTAKEPAVTVLYGSTLLTEGGDYTLSYAGNVDAGTATVTVAGAGNYTGTATASFAIEPAEVSSLLLSKTSYTYSGKANTPSVTVKAATGTLAAGTDYTVAYASGRKAVGSYKVTVKGTGNYTGTLSKSFTVKPGKVTLKSAKAGKKGSKKLTAKWKKLSGGVSYQVAYKAKGGKWKYATVGSKKASKVLKKLAKGKKYTVKVRAYKKVSGKTYYGAWSKSKSVKVK